MKMIIGLRDSNNKTLGYFQKGVWNPLGQAPANLSHGISKFYLIGICKDRGGWVYGYIKDYFVKCGATSFNEAPSSDTVIPRLRDIRKVVNVSLLLPSPDNGAVNIVSYDPFFAQASLSHGVFPETVSRFVVEYSRGDKKWTEVYNSVAAARGCVSRNLNREGTMQDINSTKVIVYGQGDNIITECSAFSLLYSSASCRKWLVRKLQK